MSQYDLNITNTTSGADLVTGLASWEQALLSGHSGSARPAYAVAGTTWTSTAVIPWVEYMFDGVEDIPVRYINPTTNVAMPAGFSAPVLGTTGQASLFGGVNVKCGVESLPTTGTVAIAYPQPFATATMQVVPSIMASSSSGISISVIPSPTHSGFSLHVTNTNNASGSIQWFAIGY